MGLRDCPARFHGVPVRFEERQELLSPPMFGRIALQRESQPPYAYGFSSLLYYKHLLKPICDETVLIGGNVIYVTKIEDAYIGSGYLARRYGAVEVNEMLRFVKGVCRDVIEGI
jgi:hypothetical protein